MQDKLLGKGIALTIILLFLGMSIVPSTANPLEHTIMLSNKGNTLYVVEVVKVIIPRYRML